MFTWLVGSAARTPVLVHFRSSKTFIIVAVATAVFTDVFLYGIVVPVLPFALVSRSGVAQRSVQTWISIFLAVYGGALLIASPFCGFFADRSASRRAPLLLGLLALAGATVVLCVGSSVAVLAVGRVLQGFSAAVVWTVGLALLVDTVGSQEVGQAMGYVGLSMSLAVLFAPLLGGVVFAASGYDSVFAMAFGLIALDVILRLLLIEKKVARQWVKEDVGSQVTGLETQTGRGQVLGTELKDVARNAEMVASATTVEGTGTEDITPTEQTPPTPLSGEGDAAPISLIGSPIDPAPIKKFAGRLPPVFFLFTSRRILCALWACLIQASLFTAFDTILPLFVRDTFGWNSLGAGLIFLPIVVVSFSGPVFGWASDKYGARWLATVGFVTATPFLILLRLIRHDSLGQKALLCALLALVGLSLTMILTPMMAEITYAVADEARRHPPEYFGRNGAYAQAYSLFNMAWAGGCLVGPLLAGLVNQRAGWATTTLILGVVSLVTAIPTALFTGGDLFTLTSMRLRRQRHLEDAGGGGAEVE